MSKKFEYRVGRESTYQRGMSNENSIYLGYDILSAINKWGKEGWELVSVSGEPNKREWIFKREIQDQLNYKKSLEKQEMPKSRIQMSESDFNNIRNITENYYDGDMIISILTTLTRVLEEEGFGRLDWKEFILNKNVGPNTFTDVDEFWFYVKKIFVKK